LRCLWCLCSGLCVASVVTCFGWNGLMLLGIVWRDIDLDLVLWIPLLGSFLDMTFQSGLLTNEPTAVLWFSFISWVIGYGILLLVTRNVSVLFHEWCYCSVCSCCVPWRLVGYDPPDVRWSEQSWFMFLPSTFVRFCFKNLLTLCDPILIHDLGSLWSSVVFCWIFLLHVDLDPWWIFFWWIVASWFRDDEHDLTSAFCICVGSITVFCVFNRVDVIPCRNA